MIEKALQGTKKYYILLISLAAIAIVGVAAYIYQIDNGLAVTGMNRDVTWGLYIAQFTFFVGVAASAVTVVLPYYLHDFKSFGKITVLGEFLAVASCFMCMMFIVVDMGQPSRVLNVFIYGTPNSMMFWDTVVLMGYLGLNLLISWTTLGAEGKGIAPPQWIKPFIYLSIPWAVSIHTVTAFLYAGLPGKHLWLSAIVAARFLASAFAAGPALLILLAMILKRFTSFDVGAEPLKTMAKIVAYAFCAHIFFIGLEFFTAYYSGIHSHSASLNYLFFGTAGKSSLVGIMWFSVFCAIGALLLLLVPSFRNRPRLLALAAAMVFISAWIDKGIGFVVGGFIPNSMEKIVEYWPTAIEILVAAGIWAIGGLIVTVLFQMTVKIRENL